MDAIKLTALQHRTRSAAQAAVHEILLPLDDPSIVHVIEGALSGMSGVSSDTLTTLAHRIDRLAWQIAREENEDETGNS